MSTLVMTLAFAFLIVILALGCLAIGWLVTGKSKIRPGACGRNPSVDRNGSECGKDTEASCHICKKPGDEKK